MESVATSTINQPQGRELLVQALNNCDQHAMIRALIERYWSWQKQFEMRLSEAAQTKNSTPFYCVKERCLVIREDQLQKIYTVFKSHRSENSENDVNAQQALYQQYSILPLSSMWTFEQTVKIRTLHNKLLREDLINDMKRVFATEEQLSAVKSFWQYKVNKCQKSITKFIKKYMTQNY